MIRQFEPGDAAACCALVRGCVARDPSISASLKEKLSQAESPEGMVERAGLFYLAVYDFNGSILGVGGVELNEIRLLYVAPEHRGEGIGKALLDHLASMVPSTPFADIFVYSTPSAVGFYRAHGFRENGEFVFDFGGEPLTTVFMTRPTR